MGPQAVRGILESALSSLDGLTLSQGIVATSVVWRGEVVATITPLRGQLIIQCVQRIPIETRRPHLMPQHSRDRTWAAWVTGSSTGLASFAHQLAAMLPVDAASQVADSSSTGLNPALAATRPGSPAPSSPRNIPSPSRREDAFIEAVGHLDPAQVERIAAAWNDANPRTSLARAVAIRSLSPRWLAARSRLLEQIEQCEAILGDDLPWDEVRAAALDALRAIDARSPVDDADRATLSAPWNGRFGSSA